MKNDVAIIGGGIAGSIAALTLARAGQSVVLFEKTTEPHDKVCGEFYSYECSSYLEETGLSLDSIGALSIENFELHCRELSLTRKLPKTARSVSRKILDETLLDACQKANVDVQRGVQIASLESLSARSIICATGKSDFKAIGKREGRDSKWVGYKLHLTVSSSSAKALRNYIELFVFPGGYGGLSLVSDDTANLAFVIRADLAKEIGVDWFKIATFLSRESLALNTLLKNAEPLTTRPLTISPMPYGYLREEAPAKNIFCVGDQLAVIPSLTGDGMAIAMMSGTEAAHSILESGFDSAELFHKRMKSTLKPQVRTAYALHKLFCSPTALELAMQLATLWPRTIDKAFDLTRLRKQKRPTSATL